MNSSLSTTCRSRNFCIARIYDLNLAHHLSDNDLKMFVVNFHTLKPVYFLYFINNIFLTL